MDRELKVYVNGMLVDGEPKAFHFHSGNRVGKSRYGVGRREYSLTLEVEDSYPLYKLVFGDDLKASKIRFKDIRDRYYCNRNKLMELWQRKS